jgi:hypothetical protein
VWDHVVRCTCVRNEETCGWPRLEERKCLQVHWGAVKEGKVEFWELDCFDPFWIDRGGMVATGGWTEDAEIWVGGGGRVRDWVFSGGVRGMRIDGNVGFRLCTISLVYLPFIFPFIVKLVARIVGIRLSGGR